jgi:hypothetical protein
MTMPTDTVVITPIRQNAAFWVQLSAVVAVLIVVSRLIAIIDAPDIWLDEAMLMANLPLDSLSAAFQPLPHHAQTAPPGYLILASVISSVLGEQQDLGLRLLSLAGSLGAMAFMFMALVRLGATWITPIALALVFLSPFGVRYGIEIKQYSFELLATSLMLYATVRLTAARASTTDLWFLVGAGVAAMLFSFAAPLIVAGFAAGFVATAIWRRRRVETRSFLVMAGLTTATAVWHLAVVAPITSANFAYWAHHYEAAYLNLPVIGPGVGVGPRGYLSIMFGMFDPFYEMQSGYYAQRWIALAAAVFLLVGLVAALRAMPVVALSCAACLVGVAVLSAAGLYPIVYTRHFTFVQPVVGIILALGIGAAVTFLMRRFHRRDVAMAGKGVAALIAVVFGVISIEAGATQQKTHLTDALVAIEHDNGMQGALVFLSPNTKIKIDYMAYRPPQLLLVGPDDAVPIDAGLPVWVLESFVFSAELPEVTARVDAIGARYGACVEAHRFGRLEDLGFTIVFRCGG